MQAEKAGRTNIPKTAKNTSSLVETRMKSVTPIRPRYGRKTTIPQEARGTGACGAGKCEGTYNLLLGEAGRNAKGLHVVAVLLGPARPETLLHGCERLGIPIRAILANRRLPLADVRQRSVHLEARDVVDIHPIVGFLRRHEVIHLARHVPGLQAVVQQLIEI